MKIEQLKELHDKLMMQYSNMSEQNRVLSLQLTQNREDIITIRGQVHLLNELIAASSESEKEATE